MSKRYSVSIIEPHPSVPSSHYFSTGRGGAGNVTKAPSSVTSGTEASGPASAFAVHTPLNSSAKQSQSQPQPHRRAFTAGRGGAGNVHPSSERAIFSFDEELERQLSQERHAAPVYHVGRGGAGNKVSASSASQGVFSKVHDGSSNRRRSSEHSEYSFASARSSGSASGSESGADHFNRGLRMGWKKMMGAA